MGPPPLPPRYDVRVPLPEREISHADTQRRVNVGVDEEDAVRALPRRHSCAWRPRCCRTTPVSREKEQALAAALAAARAESRRKATEKFEPGGHLSQSVYIWACGHKAPDQEEDLKTSDELIGFLILVLQALSYIVVIRRSGDIVEGKYSITSVTAALYLLVQTAAPDLRTGFSLLADTAHRRYFLFGVSMLVLFALLVTAAMKVIFSSAENDATVVANAVTILFVADLDEQVLSFFLKVPQDFRLVWVTNIISISFALALIGILYVGNPEAVADGANILEQLPTWFAFTVNPAAVTFFSFAISRSVMALCETRMNGDGAIRELWMWKVLRQGTKTIVKAVKKEPFLYATICVWFGVSCASWATAEVPEFPFFIVFSIFESSDSYEGPHVTKHRIELVAANLALAAGLVMRALRSCSGCARQPVSLSGPLPSSTVLAESADASTACGDTSDRISDRSTQASRVPSLLVGWGMGYWLMSLLYVLGSSWQDGGWHEAPLLVSILAYVAIPFIFVMGIFLVADRDVLGPDVVRLMGPVIAALKDDAGVLHWTVVTLLRDVTMLWIFIIWIAFPYLDVL